MPISALLAKGALYIADNLSNSVTPQQSVPDGHWKMESCGVTNREAAA